MMITIDNGQGSQTMVGFGAHQGWLSGHMPAALMIAGAIAWGWFDRRDIGLALIGVGVGMLWEERRVSRARAAKTSPPSSTGGSLEPDVGEVGFGYTGTSHPNGALW
jgi:hypothetical protein